MVKSYRSSFSGRKVQFVGIVLWRRFVGSHAFLPSWRLFVDGNRGVGPEGNLKRRAKTGWKTIRPHCTHREPKISFFVFGFQRAFHPVMCVSMAAGCALTDVVSRTGFPFLFIMISKWACCVPLCSNSLRRGVLLEWRVNWISPWTPTV